MKNLVPYSVYLPVEYYDKIKELAKDLIEKRATAKDAGKASKKDVATAKAVSSMSVKQVEMA
jgi:hypothetical protein